MKARDFVLLTALVSCAALPGRAQTAEQWITKARARLGSEQALTGVTSIRFTCTLETTEKVPSAGDPAVLVEQPVSRPLEIIFQKPHQQCITVTFPTVIEVTALDGYDAWVKRINPENPLQWQLTLLDPPQIKRLRAQAWDNLNFLGNVEKMGGTVQLAGEETVEGHNCVKLAFAYPGGMVLTRYFDRDTARLIRTVTESDMVIREEGEQIVAGIRFARQITNRAADGQLTTILIDQVSVNEKIPPDKFAVPAMRSN